MTFTKTDHILDHKSHLNKFKRTEDILSMLSENNIIKLKIHNRMIAGKSQNTWRVNKFNNLLKST